MKGIQRPRPLRALWLLAVLLPGASIPVWSQTAVSFPGNYRLGPRDLVEIKVFELPELNLTLRVADDGTVTLPLLGPVRAEGATETELAERIRVLLEAKYVQKASVTVQVKEYRARPIAVLGAVRQPGTLAFSGRWRLLDVIAAVGGLSENHGGEIKILRRAANGLQDQVIIPVEEAITRANPDFNIPIFADDIITVPATHEVVVYCLGEVARPGAISFRSNERITVLAAIAKAGGLTESASKKILVRRARSDDGHREITVDYRRILSGKEADLELQSGDFIIVKEALF